VPVAGMIKNVLAFTVMFRTHEANRPPRKSRNGLEDNTELACK